MWSLNSLSYLSVSSFLDSQLVVFFSMLAIWTATDALKTSSMGWDGMMINNVSTQTCGISQNIFFSFRCCCENRQAKCLLGMTQLKYSVATLNVIYEWKIVFLIMRQ